MTPPASALQEDALRVKSAIPVRAESVRLLQSIALESASI